MFCSNSRLYSDPVPAVSSTVLQRSAPASGADVEPGAVDCGLAASSLLAHLLMQFPFIGAGHPSTVVLMNCGATDLHCAAHGLGFVVVHPLAMGLGPTAVEKGSAKQREESEPMH
jgi:hypothetical protein